MNARELRQPWGTCSPFNAVAKLYDEARPGYPEQLIEDVISLSAIPPNGSILEIGCGTGQATLPFARRGYSMLCLELGGALAALAAEHCRPYPHVAVRNVSFEEWPLQGGAFDLVLSAQAFDWIPPEIGYPKAAAALKDTGSLALFWNHHLGGDAPFFRAVKEARRRIAPQTFTAADEKPLEAVISERAAEITASGLFGEVAVRRYHWSEEYTTERYLKLLSTYSTLRSLAEEVRRDFLAGTRELLERHGGVVETSYLAVLYVARVRR